MASLVFVFPLIPGKTEEWSDWVDEILRQRRSEYHAFRRHLGLTAHRMYLQHTPQGDTAIVYLEGNDLQRTLQELQRSQDPFTIWFRQRAKDFFDGLDWTQTSLGASSRLVFNGPSIEDDEATYRTWDELERGGMTSP